MKIRFLPVCVLLALLLTGCGHAAPETTAPTLPETQAAATQPTQTSQPETLPTETQPTEEHFLLTFAGDCTFGSNPTNYYAESGFIKTVGDDYAYPFANVIDYFAGDEFSMVNLEGPLCDEGNPMQKKHVFHGPTAYVNCLTENSIEAVTVANNHSMDYGANGYASTLAALERECARQGKTHRVIVMADLGDLREGFWDKDELVEVCARVERELSHVHLAGIGVNLTCYGSTKPTPEKMHELLALRRRIEARIGRTLEVASGGATSSFTLVHWGTMPEGIDHLRIGEAILLGKDLQVDWGIRDMDYLQMDALTLRAEVIEVKDKPTYPIGEFAIDAFGRKPVYEDRGVRRRAILALGRADVGELESLIPREPGLTVIGGSSDHCIVDVEDCPRHLEVGDVVEFSLCYSHMLYATARSDMRINFKHIQEAE